MVRWTASWSIGAARSRFLCVLSYSHVLSLANSRLHLSPHTSPPRRAPGPNPDRTDTGSNNDGARLRLDHSLHSVPSISAVAPSHGCRHPKGLCKRRRSTQPAERDWQLVPHAAQFELSDAPAVQEAVARLTAALVYPLDRLHFLPVKKNEFGTPFLNDAIPKACPDDWSAGAGPSVVAVVNSDMVLDKTMADAIQTATEAVYPSDFLAVGRRCEVDYHQQLPFSDGCDAAVAHVLATPQQQCVNGATYAIDYFVFTPAVFRDSLPDFLVGRGGVFDQYMVHYALEMLYPVIDMGDSTLAVHLNHEYCHLGSCLSGTTLFASHAGGAKHPEEIGHNRKLFGDRFLMGQITLATYKLLPRRRPLVDVAAVRRHCPSRHTPCPACRWCDPGATCISRSAACLDAMDAGSMARTCCPGPPVAVAAPAQTGAAAAGICWFSGVAGAPEENSRRSSGGGVWQAFLCRHPGRFCQRLSGHWLRNAVFNMIEEKLCFMVDADFVPSAMFFQHLQQLQLLPM